MGGLTIRYSLRQKVGGLSYNRGFPQTKMVGDLIIKGDSLRERVGYFQ